MTVGALSPPDARAALAKPAAAEGVTYEEDALAELLRLTDHYPYFLQEYGKHVRGWRLPRENEIEVLTVSVPRVSSWTITQYVRSASCSAGAV